MWKRAVDIAGASLVLLCLCIPLPIIVIILKLTGEREAFYFQDRVGYQGRSIRITKFVTMVKDSPNLGTRDITLKNDPRVLPVGRLLRKTKVNELPQFWDVLVGKLSLVGWRPLMPEGFADYPQQVQEVIVQVKPGLTGMGSLFFRDEEAIISAAADQGKDLRACYREDIMPYKGALEVWYVGHQSFWTDLKILLGTVGVVLRPGWTGFAQWFPDLPQPTSPLIREHFSKIFAA